ncbi:MAG: DUF4123 domain-containing protein [Erythrobacter sp.]|jgi:hypothetical protein|nr:DUF4123 domain-containing protein [Erythrobacter sp.]
MASAGDWFAVVDCAADPGLHPLVIEAHEHACLYEVQDKDADRSALPHLVRLRSGERIAEAWRQHETGRYWGMLCQSLADFAALRRHLRRFTTARLPDGEVVLFRFWDPRVFGVFAESGTAEEVAPFFRKIESVVIDLGPEGRRRYAWGDRLLVERAQPAQAGAAR